MPETSLTSNVVEFVPEPQKIRISVHGLAEMFCQLGDEGQAQFFIDVAEIASHWDKRHGGASYQWFLVGKHLRTCTCSTYEARAMITDIASGLDNEVE